MRIKRHVKHMSSFIGTLIVTVGILGVQMGVAATYYVATSGHDVNPGTDAKPFRTLNKGVRVLRPGDTLLVKAGTYAEMLDNKIPSGTSWSAPVTVKAASGSVVIKPPAGSYRALLIGTKAKYIVFDGFIIDGSNVRGEGLKIDGSPGAHHIRIQNVEVKNVNSNCVVVHATTDNVTLSRLKIHGCLGAEDTTGSHGIYWRSKKGLIEETEIYNTSGYGIHLYYSTSSEVNDNIVRNNITYNNRSSGIIISKGKNNLVYNNIAYLNGTDGIRLMSHAANTLLYNNTLYQNGQFGIRILSNSGTNNILKNNIIYANKLGAIRDEGSSNLQANNLTSNPGFIDAAAFDFRLRAGSPAIDAGQTLQEVTQDIAGITRPQGGRHDIGAYEYKSSAAPMVSQPGNLHIVTAN